MNSSIIPNSFAITLEETIHELCQLNSLTQSSMAVAMGIPVSHLSAMKRGLKNCSVEHDLRLSRYFGTSEGYWLRLQQAYKTRVLKAEIAKDLAKVQPLIPRLASM
jgi:antitoxin HigA-1